MDSSENLSKAQVEAHHNEYKGNLFEYLVAQGLASSYGLEAVFLKSIPHNFSKKLQDYQNILRNSDAPLFQSLPELSKNMCKRLLEVLPKGVISVELLGKLAASSEQKGQDEVDCLVKGSKGEVFPISLKMCKSGAYVTTKSAGIKSFIKKYFQELSGALHGQKKLDQLLGESFGRMWFELASEVDESLPEGNYSQWWDGLGYSSLPGELPPSLRKIVLAHYGRVILGLYELLLDYKAQDPDLFFESILKLTGHYNPEILSACLYYQRKNISDPPKVKKIHVYSKGDIKRQLDMFKIVAPVDGQSFFACKSQDMELQIRLKPMNTFTQESLKVNCSVKFFQGTKWD